MILSISDCQKWASVNFTRYRGQKCIEISEENPKVQSNETINAMCDEDQKSLQRNPIMVLHQACEEGKLDVVKCILAKGEMDINCRGKAGRTPVMTAAKKGQLAVFDFLVNQGCDLTVLDEHGDNVLNVACAGGSTDIVRKLIENNNIIYNTESRGELGFTPIMNAAYFGQKGIFDLLTTKGCDLNVVDIYSRNILHVACLGGHVDMVKHILKLGIYDLEKVGEFGRTPLMMAVDMGQKQVVDLLKRNGCNMSAIDRGGSNILHVACMVGNVDMVRYIITLGVVGIDSRGYRGRTPLMTAAKYGHRRVVDLLVSNGCDPKAKDDDKSNILHSACSGGHVDVVKYILRTDMVSAESKGRFGRTPVLTATALGHIHVVALLVRKGCNLKAVDDTGNNVLHLACYFGHVDIVKYVIERDEINIESIEDLGRTPLSMAAMGGNRGVFHFLLSIGGNLKVLDKERNTILHIACIGGRIDIVRYLLELGVVGKEGKNKFGRTPAQAAALNGHSSIVALLKAKRNI